MSSQENAEKILFTFLGEYLMMCNKSRGYAREPDLSAQIPITFGREKLINAYENIDSAPVTKVRELINQAEADFELSYRSPVIDDNGNFAENRAQARMWLGITQSILGKSPQALDLDSPQTQGPGFAFAESASLFLGLGDFLLVGRVIQEWAESLLYAGNDQDAFNLFTIAMLTFEFSGETERGAVVRNRGKNMQPSPIDSAFLARGQVPGQEQMTTVLGCRNTTRLRNVCINKLTSKDVQQAQLETTGPEKITSWPGFTQPIKKLKVNGYEIKPWAKLSRADLANTDLAGADLTCAKLSRADLANTDLSSASLIRADLAGADLTGANLSDSTSKRLWRRRRLGLRANLEGANLSKANLSSANLSKADLLSANLSKANLTGANLSNANLTGANLSKANLGGANLSGANMSKANLTDADLTGAILTGATMPDGTIHD